MKESNSLLRMSLKSDESRALLYGSGLKNQIANSYSEFSCFKTGENFESFRKTNFNPINFQFWKKAKHFMICETR